MDHAGLRLLLPDLCTMGDGKLIGLHLGLQRHLPWIGRQ